MTQDSGTQVPGCTLVVSCPDRVGIVAAVSGFVADLGGSLLESNHHTDVEQSWFYMRNVIRANSLAVELEEFRERFAQLASGFDMHWHLRDNGVPQRVVILASHASHCLADILHRWKSGELACDIPCVVSNHENLRSMVEWHGIPFHYVPVPQGQKEEAFRQIADIVERHGAETLVLARFMQIMPPELCERYRDRLLNIHHIQCVRMRSLTYGALPPVSSLPGYLLCGDGCNG